MLPEIPNLTGKLLLAHPNLHDPNFRRSIIYLARHDTISGAFGFIINRPTAQTFAELDLSGISPLFGDTPLYLGGPVSGDSVILVQMEWDSFLKKLAIDYTNDPDVADPSRSIALVGYAGWSEGQLEREISEGSWLILDPDDTGHLMIDADASTWKTLVAQIHPDLKLLAEMPDDPSLN